MKNLMAFIFLLASLPCLGRTLAANGTSNLVAANNEGVAAVNGATNLNTQLGVLWTDSFQRVNGTSLGNGWVALSTGNVFPTGTPSLTASNLHFAETNFNPQHIVWNTNYITSSDNFNVRCRFTVPAINANNTGPAVGWWMATNYILGGTHNGYFGQLACDTASKGKLFLYRYEGTTVTTIGTSAAISPLPVALDVIEVNIGMVGFTVTATGQDITGSSSIVSLSVTCNATNGPNFASNTRNITLIPVAGTSDVSLLEYKNLEYTRGDVGFGHSITWGFIASDKAHRWMDIWQASNSTRRVLSYAGGSQTTGSLMASLWEITNYWPRFSLSDLAGNDVRRDGSVTDLCKTNCILLVSNFDFYGLRPSWVNLQTPQNDTDYRPLNSFYTNQFAGRFIDVSTPMLNGPFGLKAAYAAADGAHLNDGGHFNEATNIVATLRNAGVMP